MSTLIYKTALRRVCVFFAEEVGHKAPSLAFYRAAKRYCISDFHLILRHIAQQAHPNASPAELSELVREGLARAQKRLDPAASERK